jgi:hypothetical protein
MSLSGRATLSDLPSVGMVTALISLALFAGLVAVGLWTIRRQARMFPRDFDRTGWSPGRGHAGWSATKFTWLSGGRG